ncbi:glycosyltransferase family 4 protein [uncultured Bacteroides sp.]|uniref:glycosyltransferase family 4 protein n=1 Tax=uncultured Bacteroides sp. TaxID=162156 RepID=UPI002676E57F|nr:glycosyltransferase family 4 protein [uncultured Bacteroides sp.]
MNILFLTMSSQMLDISASGIYTDLVRKFRNEGHQIYIIAPFERRTGRKTDLSQEAGVHLLGVKTLNVTKTNVIEKGIGQILMEYQFNVALKNYLSDVKFDLILYSTPPITYTRVIECAKKKNPNAVTYLLLKDIFPQNAIDLGMLTKSGLKGILYKSFRNKERKLYALSNYIGCMSPANVKYVLAHNPEISASIVEIAPNSFDEKSEISISNEMRCKIREKYKLPLDKPVLIYGGNLGKPQGIPFLVDCLEANRNRQDCHFVIVGNGTDYEIINNWVINTKPLNVSLFKRLPKEEYDLLANACDVGLIFLDYRFTIPNYPSRLLSYLMNKQPVIAATDPNCDTGSIAEKNGYGFWCPSNNVEFFTETINKMLTSNIKAMGEKGYQFYLNNYTIQHTYNAIVKHIKM